MEIKSIKKLKLYGFNNLTKTLSFNMYDICYAKTPEHRKAYIEYIDEEYNSERLTNILIEVANIIGANILNIAKQDYDPQGASVTMLISEGKVEQDVENGQGNGNAIGSATDCDNGDGKAGEDCALLIPNAVAAHLDKSHITVHTYPESHPDKGISTFRADIDVSTCGMISPLKALNYLINSFSSDIVIADYRVRGFTRDVSGKKYFIDHKINSIQNYIAKETRELYQMIDVNVYQDNIFHTKMLLKEFDLDNYLFGTAKKELLPGEKKKIKQRLKKEMYEIFSGRNIPKV
ncbi:s-adenosylmethionine decarboxylase proenzyme (adometdc)(samdc) [Heliomicrobium modesticaldum Ice1]|uniref:S-adenosylmethionine decarboxylase proenzyme n=1 Tax=Heliobacterium modesticaldum (strain ATCC 51547 / Ice1) TaxID=498761 RepID=SPED_HELMI|nr:adenosylmethionine decarboxylase [Heliomicrobium modesticaldum]B0TI92.1 RecName: Full=S-adenosylmethionine decarboxylase proenzyme; Short=AdoMetDC; Short=SAMDC; Contains: RecName: Full=S-adenosylmethionine decarboxylase beta chain; Contains: RecName: Full=S-adenosylmethionine decarboxylase alpha chain; Flags: Precursor [Heliomicrobium modesticaldum Ice1]ABZ83512.1 s-adenosylmethionine decarboxylase proenzyme (adometdc)(samdc) [Heliomicrobium modesticaldum Ice1]